MKLYLAQHAQAKTAEEDPDRPLTYDGWNDIRKVSAFVAKNLRIGLTKIYHSGKTRAKQTAEAINEYLEPTDGIEAIDGLDPNSETDIWLSRLEKTNDDILLVGHLPHLNRMVSRILGQVENKKMVDFKNGGIVCLAKDDVGLWSVQWVIIPDMLA
jgi:phosphohistidine phosphatase